MKKTIVILSVVIVLLLIVIGTLVYLRGNEDAWICKGGIWTRHGNPSAPMPTESCGASSGESAGQPEAVSNENEKPELIGGQKDEHGCLIGGGYSWCEPKKKCLRTWEEDCPASAQANEKGIIEGSLGYPSEGIPEMKICAENIKDKKQVCTIEQIKNKKYTHSVGYSLEVPAGSYFVFAVLSKPEEIGSDYGENYRAYYSEFVTCGLAYGCPSHAPISVPVKEGQNVSGIDPIDWYKN